MPIDLFVCNKLPQFRRSSNLVSFYRPIFPTTLIFFVVTVKLGVNVVLNCDKLIKIILDKIYVDNPGICINLSIKR